MESEIERQVGVFSTTLSQETLEKLRCCLCDEYLSCLPVYFYPNIEKIACGRCPVLSEEGPIPYKTLETFGSNLYFPCRYRAHGCSKIVALTEMEVHERSCACKQYFCPIIPLGTCPWQGVFNELIDHYKMDHEEYVLKESKFVIDISNSFEQNFLLSHQNDLFIFYLNCSLIEDTILWSVDYVGDKDVSNRLTYQIQFKNEDKNESISFPKTPIKSVGTNLNVNRAVHVKVSNTRKIIGDFFLVVCLISSNDSQSEDEPKSENVDNELLFNLECPVCNWYMCKPIYQCVTGHSICSSCKSEVHHCPTCRSSMSDIRNFTLENLSSHVKLYCENKKSGCLKILSVTEYREHVDECVLGGSVCPFQDILDCKWIGNFSDSMQHVSLKHKDYVIDSPSLISFIIDDVNSTKTYIIHFYDLIFRLFFKFENEYFYWSLQNWGTDEDLSDFMYEIDIFDGSALNQRFYLKRKCANHVGYQEVFNEPSNYVKVPCDSISNFLSNRMLVYTFQLLPNTNYERSY